MIPTANISGARHEQLGKYRRNSLPCTVKTPQTKVAQSKSWLSDGCYLPLYPGCLDRKGDIWLLIDEVYHRCKMTNYFVWIISMFVLTRICLDIISAVPTFFCKRNLMGALTHHISFQRCAFNSAYVLNHQMGILLQQHKLS